jgi:alkanesulfonate monooxygenase SsuD/methylene tetrahydromethanopterin reductase-like flavin-dependent oxidoreductase (luciferase family)
MSLKFGILWSFRNPEFARVPWPALYRSHLDLCVESEALGYDNIWLTEHHFVDDGYSPSLFPIASALAARTRHIRIGTYLILLPMHNPVRIAEDTATIDLISEGRFDLGVGLGYRPVEFSAQGISPKERGARLTEGIQIIQRLLSDESVTIDGKFSQLRDVRIRPPALQRPHPPIWLGALAPKAIERAARLGFHFQSVGPSALNAAYDQALLKFGRQPADFQIAQARAVYVAPSREQAWEIAAKPLHYMTEQYLHWFSEASDMSGADEALKALISVDEMIQKQRFDFLGEQAIVGTPKDAIEMIEEYRTRGRMTHFVCYFPTSGMPPHLIREGMTLFSRAVIPHFR